MRKYILSLLAIFLFSCNQIRYQDKFDAYADSEHAAMNGFLKYISSDTAKAFCYGRLRDKYGDSMTFYYNLMYPHGNNIGEPIYKEVKINCCNSEK